MDLDALKAAWASERPEVQAQAKEILKSASGVALHVAAGIGAPPTGPIHDLDEALARAKALEAGLGAKLADREAAGALARRTLDLGLRIGFRLLLAGLA